MMSNPCDKPVVLCVYNRPSLTLRSVAALRVAQPRHILIVADGPKAADPSDRDRCGAVLKILQAIDWPARIDWNVAPANLGIRERFHTGLDWAFDTVDEAIVLEDDCIAHPSFFAFCAELLDRYRDDPRIAIVSGTNFQRGADCGPASYYFSRYPLIWGWATWRRTWRRYDPGLQDWPALRDTPWLLDRLGDPLAAAYWRAIFDRAHAGLDTWDYALAFACWRDEALAIHPARNLISNVGFGPEATNTRFAGPVFADEPAIEMKQPLVHPETVDRAAAFDRRIEQAVFSSSPREQLQRMRAARMAGAVPLSWKPDRQVD